jgi:carboxylesterase type B
MRTLKLIILSLYSRKSQAIPRVHSPSGIYVGNSSISQLDQFLGIPYAEPPIGESRLTNPVLFQSAATTVLNATAYGPGCSQLDIFAQYNGLSEDCLTLNVIRPSSISKDHLLPVLFFIHGGGNINGQSLLYNGTALVQHSIATKQPIIYVGINYRLAGFGFLSSPALQEAGVSNLGLKDQLVALQWVQKNIESFGGDSKKVTIFGESSGAANCWAQLHYAYVRNETNRYFRGMITESGAPGSPGYPLALDAEEGTPTYTEVLEQTNCTGPESLECLRKTPYDIIAPIFVNLPTASYTIDNDWFDNNITYLVETGQFADIPIIHGSNLNEGSLFLPDVFDFPNRSALIDYVTPFVGNNIDTASHLVDVYFANSLENLGKGSNADPTAPDDFWAATAVYTDVYFDLGKHTLLGIASKTADTWGYSFRQQPPLSSLNLSYEYPGLSSEYARRVGVYHGAELPYVFGEVTSLDQHTQGDVAIAIAMMDAWISFAYCLSPNGLKSESHIFGLDSIPNIVAGSHTISWPKYNLKSRKLIVFQSQSESYIRVLSDDLRASVYKAWSTALRSIGQNPPF